MDCATYTYLLYAWFLIRVVYCARGSSYVPLIARIPPGGVPSFNNPFCYRADRPFGLDSAYVTWRDFAGSERGILPGSDAGQTAFITPRSTTFVPRCGGNVARAQIWRGLAWGEKLKGCTLSSFKLFKCEKICLFRLS